MTTPDMMEALQALAADRGMSTEVLLEAVANGLESAYKKMPDSSPDAYVVIDETFNIQVIAQEIDEEGTVFHEGVNHMPVGRNVNEFLRLVDAYAHVQTNGEVCPANWEEGKTAMAPNAKGTAAYLASN